MCPLDTNAIDGVLHRDRNLQIPNLSVYTDQMKRITTFALLILCLLPAGIAFGFAGGDKDCSKCHALAKDEAEKILKDIIPDVKVAEVNKAPSGGLWELIIESGGRKGIVYIDYAKKNLFSGAVISIKERKNLTQERMSDITRVDVSQIPLDDAIVMGDKNAKYRAIVFSDPD